MARPSGGGSNPHFVQVADWADVLPLVDFEPRVPEHTAGLERQNLTVFVMDHRKREVARSRRSVEAHYGDFVFAQSMPGVSEAKRLALSVAYGVQARTVGITGCEGRGYERGPPVGDEDPDGRSPAVVTWCDGPLFFLLASTELDLEALVRIGRSVRHPSA